MGLKSIQLCHMDPSNRARDEFTVTCNSDDGHLLATFDCASEGAARHLRDAIRDYAVQLRRVADYRPARQERPTA